MKGKRIVLVGCSSWWIELFGEMKILNITVWNLALMFESAKSTRRNFAEISRTSPQLKSVIYLLISQSIVSWSRCVRGNKPHNGLIDRHVSSRQDTVLMSQGRAGQWSGWHLLVSNSVQSQRQHTALWASAGWDVGRKEAKETNQGQN